MESGLHISLSAERLFTLWGFPITNSLIMEWLVIVAILLSAYLFGLSLKLNPGRTQAGVEQFYEYLMDMIASTLGSRQLAERYFPLIATIFIFILTANLFEFLPIIGPITAGGVPLLHTATSDLYTTLALAIIAFFVIEVSGVLTLGLLKYGSKFVNFKGGAMGFAVGLIEIIGNLARLISFSFRLFGAVFAGEVLLLVIAYFIPYVASVPFMAFEAFVGLLQAAVFALLTMAFIKLSIDEPHGGERHEGDAVGAH